MRKRVRLAARAPSASQPAGVFCFGSSDDAKALSDRCDVLDGGSYSVVARSILNGALLALQEVNASSPDIELEPVVVNPCGDLVRYRSLSLELLGSGTRQVVGMSRFCSTKMMVTPVARLAARQTFEADQPTAA